MDRITEVTRDCFGAIFQLRRLATDGSVDPRMLHDRMRRFVEATLDRASDAGFTQTDAQDIAYALVALADEVALNGPGPVRDYWTNNLLQMAFFRENQAGDGFFTRLEAIRRDGGRRDLLHVYQLCLLFGFQGRYWVRGGEVERMDLVDGIARELAGGRRSADAEVLSPSATRPSEGMAQVSGNRLLVFAAAGAVALSVLLFGALKLGISSSADSLTQQLSATAGR